LSIKRQLIDLPGGTVAKAWALRAAVAAAFLAGASAIAYASVPKTWVANESLASADLNANFAALDARLSALEAPGSRQPPGTIVAFGGSVAPPGWFLCDGTALDGTKPDYAALYGAIGVAFGGNSTSRSFNVPDLRGRFLRGLDNGTGNDPDVARRTASNPGGSTGPMLGTLEGDSFASHSHGVVDPGHTHALNKNIAVGGDWTNGGNNWALATNLGTPFEVAATTAMTNVTIQNAGGAETRPKNVAVNYIIKL
jgi:microcystin-dependent protein